MGKNLEDKQLGKLQPDESITPVARAMGAMCYLGIFIIIPACSRWRQEEFVKYHLNQGLVLLALGTVCGAIVMMPYGAELSLTLTLLVDALSLVGLVQALRKIKQPLPVVSRLTRNFHPFE